MDKVRRTQLEAAGVDVDEALGRFMDNEALMMKFLLRFPGDSNFPLLRRAMAAGDIQGAFEAAHTLKGVTGNLSLKGFYRLISALVEDLRGEDYDTASGKMAELEERYAHITAALEELAQ